MQPMVITNEQLEESTTRSHMVSNNPSKVGSIPLVSPFANGLAFQMYLGDGSRHMAVHVNRATKSEIV